MTDSEGSGKEVVLGKSHEVRASPKMPPHPLDSKWHLEIDGETYGPFTGHELKEFVDDGRLRRDTDVIRSGGRNWVHAEEDPALARLFGGAPQRQARPEAWQPDSRIDAGRGATVVQVTNNLAPPQHRPIVIDGTARQKSAGVALLLSILLVGLGQIYNGEVGKGVLMFLGCVLLWIVMLGWVVMIWSWIDAYQSARAMNERYMQKLAAGFA